MINFIFVGKNIFKMFVDIKKSILKCKVGINNFQRNFFV